MAKLAVALDLPSRREAEKLMGQLEGLDVVYKIGLELFIGEGPQWVHSLVKGGKEIFLDLKLHDIPNTVCSAVSRVCDLGVSYLTVHLANGRVAFDQIGELRQKKLGEGFPKILGVSVLTSFGSSTWGELTEALSGKMIEPSASVHGLVKTAATWPSHSIDGVVSSALELEFVKKVNPNWIAVIPGIRPTGSPSNDQARVVTPAEALTHGADLLVVGRPISGASDPRRVVESLIFEIDQSEGQL